MTPAAAAWRRLRANRMAFACLIGFALICLACAVGPLVCGWFGKDGTTLDLDLLASAPSWSHPLGTDSLGRDLLVRVFSTQNAVGDWPQWFTFFARDRGIRAGDSHGDIVFWPLLGLARYLEASSDHGLLDTLVPFHCDGPLDQAERVTMWAHVERALAHARVW